MTSRRRTEPEQVQVPPSVPPGEGVERLKQQVRAAETLLSNRAAGWDDFDTWDVATEQALRLSLGEPHPLAREVMRAGEAGVVLDVDNPGLALRHRAERLAKQIKMLGLCIGELDRLAAAQPTPTARASRVEPVDRVLHILDRFPLVVRQIRARHVGRSTIEVNDEYDVQDLLHALLRIDFEDIRPEEWTPSYAGGSSRMDFLLKQERLVVETKITRAGRKEKVIGEELLIDIARYKEHQECRTLVCFVFDPSHEISNPAGLERDLSAERDGVDVRMVVRPRG